MIIKTERLADYYIVELEEPLLIGNDTWYREQYLDVDAWCEQTFGAQDVWGEEPVNGWKRMRNKYFFTSEGQVMIFTLMWS